MILYRFTNKKFSNDISGEGSRLFGGRWNSKGTPAVYTSLTISLSLLELLIHSTSYEEIETNQLMIIDTNVEDVSDITLKQLKANWQHDEDYCRYIGDNFLQTPSKLLLKAPSVIIPDEHNVIINPRHKDFNKVKIKSVKSFDFDVRLFKS
jgi:RES domain-containing protein